jgi:hypothetical protein
MTNLARRAVILAACGLVLAAPAGAKCFSRQNVTLRPVLVTDLAHSLLVPNPGPLTSCFRDINNVPCPYGAVTIDFSPCGGDVELAEDQERTDVVVNCAARTITITAGSDGCVVLGPILARTGIQVTGWPQAPGVVPPRNIGPAEAVGPCAVVYYEGFPMGTVPVHVVRYDLDGDTGVDAGDVSYELDAVGHFLAGPPPDPAYRTFYDHDLDGDVDAGDVAAQLRAVALYLTGQRAPYAGPYCP